MKPQHRNTDNRFLKEYILCTFSFLAFVVRHCRIQDRRTQSAIRFWLWPGQQRVAPLFLSEKRLIILKARQLGLTWLAAAYALWRAIFHPNELIIIISAKEDLAVEFLERVKYMFDRLPSYLKPRVYKRTTTELSFGYEEKDYIGNIVLRGLNSVIKSLPSTPEAGQSKTISLLIMDETALNPYNKEIWSAAQPTLEHSDGDVIIISNPTKTGKGWGWTRKLYTDSIKGVNTFRRIFLDPFVVPSRGPDFIKHLMEREGLTEEDRIMQYPLNEQEAISSVAGTYFGNYILKFNAIKGIIGDFRMDRKHNMIIFEENPKGIVELWRWPQKKWVDRYAIGSDVGEGLGGSFSVGYVYDRHLEEFVCRMRSNKIEADRWADLLIYMGIYFNRAKIGAERMGPGITTVQHLQRKKYSSLYMRRREGRTKGTFTYEVGFHTNDESKRLAVSHLKSYYRDVLRLVPCAVLLDESSTFIEYEDGGGLGAESGAFDDCVMAAAITLQVSKVMPEPRTMTDAQEKGWRDKLWGDVENLKAYSVADM